MQHVVTQGECISSIAAQYGMAWRKIWDAPENDHLRSTGRAPNVLLPGDSVHVPNRDPNPVSVATNQRHRFTVEFEQVLLRIRLVANLEALADEPYQLEINGRVFEGTTDQNGQLEHEVAPTTRAAKLSLPNRAQRYHLRIGFLDPELTISGAQARLRSLGLYEGKVDGELGPSTATALAIAQDHEGLEVSGELNTSTSNALRELHGS